MKKEMKQKNRKTEREVDRESFGIKKDRKS